MDSWHPEFCMVMVWAIVILLSGGNPRHLLAPPTASVDTVLEVAMWAQFEEITRWNHHVEACLIDLGHDDTLLRIIKSSGYGYYKAKKMTISKTGVYCTTSYLGFRATKLEIG